MLNYVLHDSCAYRRGLINVAVFVLQDSCAYRRSYRRFQSNDTTNRYMNLLLLLLFSIGEIGEKRDIVCNIRGCFTINLEHSSLVVWRLTVHKQVALNDKEMIVYCCMPHLICH